MDALLKVGVIIKVVVFRTLRCVVPRIALATDCCCWSVHRVRQQLIDGSIIKYKDLLEMSSRRVRQELTDDAE